MINNAIGTPRPPPITDDLDASLIQSALQGNKSSFGQLMRMHQPLVFLMVHRHLRQREEAEDVVQQVFLKVYQHLKDFRGESKFSTWIYTIALNLVRNHVRQRKIRRMESLDVSGTTENGPGRQWPDKLPSPEKISQDRWDLARVQTIVKNLPEPHRTIFNLHYFQHLSLMEVGVRVKRPVGTVKVYLHRARKMILGQLESRSKK